MGEQTITLRDILVWIIDNQNDMDSMDKINKATFVHTSNYMFYDERRFEAHTQKMRQKMYDGCIYYYHHDKNIKHTCNPRKRTEKEYLDEDLAYYNLLVAGRIDEIK